MTVYIPRENKRFNVSGNLTLSENIADAGGIRAAYRAYESWRAGNGAEAMLVGMPGSMTWKKLFFLAAVQPFCQESTGLFMLYITRVGPHTPSMARVKGLVMNTDDFSSAFQCPKGSPMNPTEKCQLW
ncbi:endothelin-converting enzyme 1-like [Lineus longissimus]|uniref:endothelin-converting enzyme 1-like n=1 Tax=Lineus longissimus TaxID=88925 RepID=UPI00315C646A